MVARAVVAGVVGLGVAGLGVVGAEPPDVGSVEVAGPDETGPDETGPLVDATAAVDATADELTDDTADFELLEHAGASRARSTGAAMTKRDGRMGRSLAPALLARWHQKSGRADI